MIEINRGKSEYIYRINPHQPRIIDRRRNVHGGRWERFAAFDSDDKARAYLLSLERNQPPKTECHQ